MPIMAMAGLGSAGSAALAAPAAPALEFAFRLQVLIAPPQDMGLVDGIRRRVIPITGGTVEDHALPGVLPGGGDWQGIGPDGIARIEARYTIEAEDGTLIGVTNPGMRHGPPRIIADIAAGKDVDPALYYFRTTPRFDVAADSRHGWMARTIFLCSAARYRDHVRLDVFSVA
ncbi:DUF3237 domain-containing protein [Sphingobium scionense]